MSSLVSSTWDFLKRHRGKIVVLGGAVGGYYFLNKYLSDIEKSWEKSASKDFVSEVRKKETHFESTIQTCNSTVLALTPKVLQILDQVLDAEPILEQLRSSPEKKIQLWQELKVKIFTRAVAEVYSLSLFVCYLRVQLSVISGYMYVDSLKNGSTNGVINQSIQMKYLSLLTSFYQNGIRSITKPLEEAVGHTFGQVNLKEKVTFSDLKAYFEKIKSIMSFSLSSPDVHFSSFLIKPQEVENLVGDNDGSSSATLTPKEIEIIKKMLMETQDILESNDFRQVLDSSIEIGFSIMMDLILGCLVQLDSKTPKENGFSNPHTVQVPLAKLLPALRQSMMDRKKPDEVLVLVRHLICLDVLNCFAANVYEAFCEQ